MDDRIRKFLEERRKILEAKGVESNLTFYNPQTGKPYSDMSFRKLKKRVEEIAGVSFKLKEFRATLTSLTLDSHYERIPTMALQLRHKSPDTTRRYYARINKKKEIEEGLGDLWEESEIK